MKFLASLYLSILLNIYAYSQNNSAILFQYSGQSISIRKSGENNPIYYSEKNDRLITYKEELEVYPDSTYYVVKPTLIIFEADKFESDVKPQINIRVDYYYQTKEKSVKIENWGKSYYPSIKKVVRMQDTRVSDGKVTFTMDDKSVWIVETEKDGSTSLFYITQEEFSLTNYALMFPNCKTEIINGKRL